MGAGHSEFDEIENAIRQGLHDRRKAQELSLEKDSLLVQRELEYTENLRQLSLRLEEKEKKLKQITEEVEAARRKAKEATDMLHMELNQNISALREQIQLYQESDSANLSPRKFNVGLFGNTGVGKTSLLNSMKFAVRGKLSKSMKVPVAPANFQGAHTILRLSVGITPSVAFIDNRGIGPEHLGAEGAIEELMKQLDGRASFTKPVDWRTPNQQASKTANTSNIIFCSILVIDARNVKSIGPHGKSFLQCLLKWHGIYPIAVMTHIDVATPKEVEDTRRAIKSTGITEVYAVANITDKRPELEVEYQSSLLRLLERCMNHFRSTLEYRNAVEKAN